MCRYQTSPQYAILYSLSLFIHENLLENHKHFENTETAMEHTCTNGNLANPLSLFSTSQFVRSVHFVTFATRVKHVCPEHETAAEHLRVSHCWWVLTRDSYRNNGTKRKKRRQVTKFNNTTKYCQVCNTTKG